MQAVIPFPDISPEIFSLTLGGFTFALRWYALAYIAGLLIGWRLVLAAIRRPSLWPGDTPPMTAEQVERLLTWVILGVLVGGRLGYTLIYQPVYYLANPLEILHVWQGGMSFHGGFLGVVLAAWIFTARESIPRLQAADALALAAPPGLFLGRVANFINAELWGRPSMLPWAVIFPGDDAQDCPIDWLGPCARHPSQLYEAALEGLLLGALLLTLAFRGRALKAPGRITGLFLAGYGLSRFVVEFFRVADAQFIAPGNPWGHVALGLTMGQLLSLPMIALGLWMALRARPVA